MESLETEDANCVSTDASRSESKGLLPFQVLIFCSAIKLAQGVYNVSNKTALVLGTPTVRNFRMRVRSFANASNRAKRRSLILKPEIRLPTTAATQHGSEIAMNSTGEETFAFTRSKTGKMAISSFSALRELFPLPLFNSSSFFTFSSGL